MIQRIILGSLLIDYGIHDLAIPLLKPEYFDYKRRRLFELMAEMYRKSEPIDSVTVFRHIGKEGFISATELTELTREIASTANILSYIQQLKDGYLRSQLMKLTGLEVPETEDPGQPLAAMINKLVLLQQEQVIGTDRNIVDIADEALGELLAEKNTQGMLGIPMPSNLINQETRGMRNGELIIVAGRPGMGKTAFALSIVRVACEAGYTVAYFSMEMKDIELVKRMIRAYTDYETGAGKISAWDLHLFDKECDLNFIRSNVRLLRNCQLVVVDYLGLMKMNNRIKRAEAVGEVSRGLKAFAMEANIPVVLLSQLNRDSEARSSAHHRLSDLRESGDIEQDADKVFFITRPGMIGENSMKNPDDRSIIIQKEKDRNGQAPKFFKMMTNETFTQFYDETEIPEGTQEHKGNSGRSQSLPF